ncbi:hypothetical protein QJ854_gp168 [Moumouvirus goulette]|uniref:Uncharacterized protein n=1 Tax=Moumouvirus goulette TaxID=1247379 RepID=M1PCC0_9VIRU|nr:hypothetical protein QJ854_gp168 [Moumouvirus goulette]AGF85614.1 hypothetical protein glt_00809 [Moumouvirus goulette]
MGYKIVIKECTKGSSGKYFFYEARIINLFNPQNVIMNNKTVIFKHYNKLKKIPPFNISKSMENTECLEDIEIIEKNIEKNNPKSCVITIEI